MKSRARLCPPSSRPWWAILALSALFVLPTTPSADTRLQMSSDPGDYIGLGQSYLYTPFSATFSATRNFAGGVSVTLNVPAGWSTPAGSWDLSFAAPVGRPLTPGIHVGAVRFPFQSGLAPGLSVSGMGRGCNTVTGTFQVRQVVFGPGDQVTAFWATFEQHCEGLSPALRGEVRFNADTALYILPPAEISAAIGVPVSFLVTATDTRGRPLQLSASDMPPGAGFTDHGDGTGTFSWPGGAAEVGTTVVGFTAQNDLGETASASSFIHTVGNDLLLMVSDPGDYIGLGQSYRYTAAEATFSATRNFSGGVSMTVGASEGSWSLDFAAPDGRPLTPGVYLGAVRYPFQSGHAPGMSISGMGRGCNTVTGTFQVRQVAFGPGDQVTAFWATFEQHCEGGPPALRGEIRFNADTALYVLSPPDVFAGIGEPVSFLVTAIDASGLPPQLTASDMPPGATFTDHGNGTGTFDWPSGGASLGTTVVGFTAENDFGDTATAWTVIHTVGGNLLIMVSDPGDYIGGGQSYLYTPIEATFSASPNFDNGVSLTVSPPGGSWNLDFAAPDERPLTPGVYLGAVRFPFQSGSAPGLSVSGMGRGCNTLTGLFQVRQIALDPANQVTSFWATFEQHCEGGTPALRGEIRFNADTALYVLPPADVYAGIGEGVSFLVTATDTDGRPLQLTASGAPPGASFTDHGDGTGTFAWPAGGAAVGTSEVGFTAQNDLGQTASAPTFIHVYGSDRLYMVSDPGDYIGGGQTYEYTGANATFAVNSFARRSVHFNVQSGSQWWYLDFDAPGDALLAPGVYAGATRYPFNSENEPGLAVYGKGRGCNTLTGTFEVLQVTYGANDEVESFAAIFEQHCEGFTAALRGEIWFGVQPPVATLLSLVEARAEPDRARLTWFAPGAASLSAVVQRRTTGSDWVTIGTPIADGTDRLSFEDQTVRAGARYGYRLAYRSDGRETLTPETWLDIPSAWALVLDGLRPNPAVHELVASFTLSRAGDATLELLDVGGRQVLSREVGGLGPGPHQFRLGSTRDLPAGVYWLTLRQGAERKVRRAVVLD